MKAGLLTGLAAALSLAVPAGAADLTGPPVVQFVPADPYAVAVVPAPRAYAYDAYAYAPGYTTVTTVPPYAAPTGYSYTDRYRIVAPGRYVVRQTPSVTVPTDPAYVVVERTYVVGTPAVVEEPATVIVNRPARRVVERRTVVRNVAVPAYRNVAVPAYRNPVYDQDIRAEYVRPISCAIDAFGVERCY